MQNLVIFMEPGAFPFDISSKGGKMYFNRFCIDEDDAFELFEVRYFEPFSFRSIFADETNVIRNLALGKRKGKGNARQ